MSINMATNALANVALNQLPTTTTITIHEAWDYEVEVVQYGKLARHQERESENDPTSTDLVAVKKNRPVAAIVIFRVRKVDLTEMPRHDHTRKTFFEGMFSWNYHESRMHKVTIDDDSVKAIEVLFRVLHDKLEETIYEVPVEEMWNIIATCDKNNWDHTKLGKWFAIWHSRHPQPPTVQPHYQAQPKHGYYKWMQTLMYPCFIFDHAKGFQQSTKYLVYNSVAHIMDHNPTEHRGLHLPPRIIQQLNAARGRLKTILHRELWEPIGKRMGKDARGLCECRPKTVFDYQDALCKIDAWPLEIVWQRHDVAAILKNIRRFNWEPEVNGRCSNCTIGYSATVKQAANKTEKYFDGLCLDCINKTKTGHVDDDYWEHDLLQEWDGECRTHHGQSTWYFSFMGRPDVMKEHTAKRHDGGR